MFNVKIANPIGFIATKPERPAYAVKPENIASFLHVCLEFGCTTGLSVVHAKNSDHEWIFEVPMSSDRRIGFNAMVTERAIGACIDLSRDASPIHNDRSSK